MPLPYGGAWLGGIGPLPGGLTNYSLCFVTVGWVIWPVKIVPNMTYNVFGGTLNPTHYSTLRGRGLIISCYFLRNKYM